jgi:alanyl-tRNA synthetase
LEVGSSASIELDRARRHPIEAHHTATHLLHWALHEVVSSDASQAGSSVSPDRLRFDFNSKALTPQQIAEIEEKVNASIQNSDTVSWIEVPHTDIKERADIMQFFGDKYGDRVRVVQIGGGDKTLDGFSMELCGGTHVRNTSDIGLFKIKSEGAIASGVRRIEALCGPAAKAYLAEQATLEAEEKVLALEKLSKANASLVALEKEAISVADSASADEVKTAAINAEKALKKAQAAGAAQMADGLISEQNITGNIVLSTGGPATLLQELMNALKKVHFSHAAFLIVDDGDKLHLGALCGEDGNNAGHGAGNLIKELGPLAGGKGGGKPDMARGAAPDRDKVTVLVIAANTELGI